MTFISFETLHEKKYRGDDFITGLTMATTTEYPLTNGESSALLL